MSESRIRLGRVDVNSGQLVIIDPCYIDGDLAEEDIYHQASAATEYETGGQLNHRGGAPGLAVAFSSGFGDGEYEVHATIRDFGVLGERVVKVEIDLIPDEDAW